LNNEFFAKACEEWRERLLRGDFTPEMLQKAKSDLEKDKQRLDPWKVITFCAAEIPNLKKEIHRQTEGQTDKLQKSKIYTFTFLPSRILSYMSCACVFVRLFVSPYVCSNPGRGYPFMACAYHVGH
jgi:hypothetical protein